MRAQNVLHPWRLGAQMLSVFAQRLVAQWLDCRGIWLQLWSLFSVWSKSPLTRLSSCIQSSWEEGKLVSRPAEWYKAVLCARLHGLCLLGT